MCNQLSTAHDSNRQIAAAVSTSPNKSMICLNTIKISS